MYIVLSLTVHLIVYWKNIYIFNGQYDTWSDKVMHESINKYVGYQMADIVDPINISMISHVYLSCAVSWLVLILCFCLSQGFLKLQVSRV